MPEAPVRSLPFRNAQRVHVRDGSPRTPHRGPDRPSNPRARGKDEELSYTGGHPCPPFRKRGNRGDRKMRSSLRDSLPRRGRVASLHRPADDPLVSRLAPRAAPLASLDGSAVDPLVSRLAPRGSLALAPITLVTPQFTPSSPGEHPPWVFFPHPNQQDLPLRSQPEQLTRRRSHPSCELPNRNPTKSHINHTGTPSTRTTCSFRALRGAYITKHLTA